MDDGTLELRVSSALSNEQIKETRINVTAYQGKVLLIRASRQTAELHSRAKRMALGVEGTTRGL